MADNLRVGAKLADYEIEGVLGEPGGFGITYRARDQRLQRQVAIKEYFPSAFAKRMAKSGLVKAKDKASEQIFDWGLERFIEEARTLAQFSHPNIVRVLHLIEALNGTAYIVMELVTGRTLETMVEEDGVLDEAAFRPLFEQLLAGCAAIHDIGIIHRDIKPSNIIVRANGEAVLIDFGAARDLALERRKGFTAAIVADGYSPPEQYSMKAQQDARSDIYALAATAYFAHTGDGPTPASARAGGDDMDPAVKAAASKARPVYLKALDHALELKADRRPSSVAEWRAEMAFPSRDPAPAKATLDRRGVLAIAGGVTILAGVTGYLALSRGGAGGGAAIDSRPRPLRVAWTKDISAVVTMPFSAVTALAGGMAIVGHEVTAGEEFRMLAIRLDNNGAETGQWRSDEAGTVAKAVCPMPDGGVLIGGDSANDQQARVIRLNANWEPVWRQSYGPGSVSCFVQTPAGIAAGIEGGNGSGQAKLLYIDADGAAGAGIALIDQATDAVQKAAVMEGGDLVILGSRFRSDGQPGSQAWVARLTPDGQSIWRSYVKAQAITGGWALATVGDDIYVAGTTRAGENEPSHHFVTRFSGAGVEQWSRIDNGAKPTSGRALALTGGKGRPRLYLGGSADGPPMLAQVGGNGDMAWKGQLKPALPGERVSIVEALTFAEDGRGFASVFVQGEGGLRRLVAMGLTA